MYVNKKALVDLIQSASTAKGIAKTYSYDVGPFRKEVKALASLADASKDLEHVIIQLFSLRRKLANALRTEIGKQSNQEIKSLLKQIGDMTDLWKYNEDWITVFRNYVRELEDVSYQLKDPKLVEQASTFLDDTVKKFGGLYDEMMGVAKHL